MTTTQQVPKGEKTARRSAPERSRAQALLVESWEQAFEAKRTEWGENSPEQTYEAYASGEPCRACGRPLLEGPVLGDEVDAGPVIDSDNAAFRSEHETCNLGFWRIENRRVEHCHLCCPFPPLSPSRREELRRILARPASRDEHTWRLELTCEHVEVATSGSYGHALSTFRCTHCAVTRGVTDATRIDDQAGCDTDSPNTDGVAPRYQLLTDEQWSRIKPIVQPDEASRRGRPRTDARTIADAVLYRAHTGIPWRDLPKDFGSWQTAARRYRQLTADGSWDAALRMLSDDDRVVPNDDDSPA